MLVKKQTIDGKLLQTMEKKNMESNAQNVSTVPSSGDAILETRKNTNVVMTESDSLDSLFASLSKAHMEMQVAKNESINPFYKSKYCSLASIVKASRPSLSKNGICIIQRVLPDQKGQLSLFTRLCHSSGQWMESKMPITPPKTDIQSMGSYITYLRRYNYASIAGVVASDEDDDGEVAMAAPRTGEVVRKENGKISKAQLQVLSQELESFEDLLEGILKGFQIGKLSDLDARHYTKCITRIREIKRAKES